MGHAETLRQMAKDYPADCAQYAAACLAGAEAITCEAQLIEHSKEQEVEIKRLRGALEIIRHYPGLEPFLADVVESALNPPEIPESSLSQSAAMVMESILAGEKEMEVGQ